MLRRPASVSASSATAPAVTVGSKRAGQQRLGRRFQNARGVDQSPALTAEILRQVHRVKAVVDQRVPPRRELSGGQRVEAVAGGGDGGVPGGELR